MQEEVSTESRERRARRKWTRQESTVLVAAYEEARDGGASGQKAKVPPRRQ